MLLVMFEPKSFVSFTSAINGNITQLHIYVWKSNSMWTRHELLSTCASGAWVSVAPLSYQIGSMLYIDVVAETDAPYQGLGKLWPQPSLLGNELPQTLDGKRVFCANIHSSCRCKDTCTY
jgi:hypothetical protein